MIGDGARRRGRAVDAGQDADVVARCHPAIGPLDAHEARLTPGRGGFHVGAEGVVARKVTLVGTHVEVVGVHMLAGCDGLAGKADDLVVAPHRVAGC